MREWHPRTVFIPTERRGIFRTHDGETYRRDADTGVIRCAQPKVRGKAARRADKVARQKARIARAAKAA